MIELIKIIGVGFVTAVFSIVLKEYKKDYVIFVFLVGSFLILYFSFDMIKEIIVFLKDLSLKSRIDNSFITVLLKITGISILSEFAVSVCKDCGENSIASKIDLGGKIIFI